MQMEALWCPLVKAALPLLSHDHLSSQGPGRPKVGEGRGLYHLVPSHIHIFYSFTLSKQGYFNIPDLLQILLK